MALPKLGDMVLYRLQHPCLDGLRHGELKPAVVAKLNRVSVNLVVFVDSDNPYSGPLVVHGVREGAAPGTWRAR